MTTTKSVHTARQSVGQKKLSAADASAVLTEEVLDEFPDSAMHSKMDSNAYDALDETQHVISDYQLGFPLTVEGRNPHGSKALNERSPDVYSKVQQDILDYSHHQYS
jgi:hypothetical protein